MRVLDSAGRWKWVGVAGAGGDYTASQITNVPAGNIGSANVQAALDELDAEKLSTVTADPRYCRLDSGVVWDMDNGTPVVTIESELPVQVTT